MKFDVVDIVEGISREEFFIEYQPICDVSSGVVVGVEALLRWHCARFGGVISPDEFLPFSTHKELMPVLGAYVVRLVCRQVALWQPMPKDFFVSINVCPTQLMYEGFALFLERCCIQYDIDPCSLRIEITEHVPFVVTQEIQAAIARIQGMGCKVLLDDFGSGYMSFSKLIMLNVEGVKICLEEVGVNARCLDKSDAVTAALVLLTASIGISLVVERIETLEQRTFLSAFKGVLGQGYYFGRPEKPVVGHSLQQFLKSVIKQA